MLNTEVKDAHRYAVYHAYMETMGERIRQLREARGLTQTQLGEATGVTKSAVSQWEGGATSNIKLQAFMVLCEVLNTDPAYLIWGPERGRPGTASRYGKLKNSGLR
jgi:transcriptional regulator with XRE-family HTH domain